MSARRQGRKGAPWREGRKWQPSVPGDRLEGEREVFGQEHPRGVLEVRKGWSQAARGQIVLLLGRVREGDPDVQDIVWGMLSIGSAEPLEDLEGDFREDSIACAPLQSQCAPSARFIGVAGTESGRCVHVAPGNPVR